MILVVGLGNPGKKFQNTRHNLGFKVIDEFLRKQNFSNFKFSKRINALISKGSLERKKIILAKPQTFMNNSGKAVKNLYTKCSILNTKKIWVVHDDIDLPLGKIKIAIGRGSAGHKGVQSIIDELGTKDFVRFRIGILHKEDKPKQIEKFVLKNFSKKEEKIIKEAIKKIVKAIGVAFKEGLEGVMQKFNK